MMKQFIFLCFILILLSSNIYSQRSIAPPADTVDSWETVIQPVWGITEDSAAKLAKHDLMWGNTSEKFIRWNTLRKLQYRNMGTIFFERNAASIYDSHFKEWFRNTTGKYRPDYIKTDPSSIAAQRTAYYKSGTPVSYVYDDSAENDWYSHFIFFRSVYLADPTVSTWDKFDFRSNVLFYEISHLGDKIRNSTGDLNKMYEQNRPLINRYFQEAVDLFFETNLPDRSLWNFPTFALRALVANFGQQDRQLWQKCVDVLKKSLYQPYREEALLWDTVENNLRSNFVNIQLPSLNSDASLNLDKLKGKVVLVDFWNIGCSGCVATMPKYERLYQQFKNKGFEILSVCVLWESDPQKRKEERIRALELEKKQGVTYYAAALEVKRNEKGEIADSLNPSFWPKYKYGFGGDTFLLDQQGHLVSTDMGGQWGEYYIRKLLGLPVEKTGLKD